MRWPGLPSAPGIWLALVSDVVQDWIAQNQWSRDRGGKKTLWIPKENSKKKLGGKEREAEEISNKTEIIQQTDDLRRL